MTKVCSWVCIVLMGMEVCLKSPTVGKSFKGGNVDSSLLANCKDKKWMNLPTACGNGGNEWGALVKFPLCN